MDISLLDSKPTMGDVSKSVQDAFQKSPVHGLRELQVEQVGSSILISGKVSSFYQKQLAQEVVRHLDPAARIVNSIVVD